MPVHVTRTSLALQTDRVARRRRVVLGAIAVLGAWTGWLCLAEVSVTVVSQRATLVGSRSAVDLTAPVTGRLLSELPYPGQPVRAGDVIARLDDHDATITLLAARAAAGAARAELAPLEDKVAALERAHAVDASLARSRHLEETSEVQRAELDAAHAARELARTNNAHSEGLVSTEARDLAELSAERLATLVDEQRLHRRTSRSEVARGHHDRAAELAAARRDLEAAHSRLTAAELTVKAAEAQVDRRVLRAPIAGRLGALGALRPGAVLSEGDFVASIVPDGALIVRAEVDAGYDGLIAAGMPAVVRLAAYPSLVHGRLQAHVSAVAGEPRDGRLQVDLAIDDDGGLPLRHGMVGTVEIVTEHASPLALVLREAGLLTTPRRGTLP